MAVVTETALVLVVGRVLELAITEVVEAMVNAVVVGLHSHTEGMSGLGRPTRTMTWPLAHVYSLSSGLNLNRFPSL